VLKRLNLYGQLFQPGIVTFMLLAVGKHRNTVQRWLGMYREGGMESMLEIKKSPGGVRVIPQWGATFRGEDSPRKLASEDSLAKRLQDSNHGFESYYAVQSAVSRNIRNRSGVSHGLPNDSLST